MVSLAILRKARKWAHSNSNQSHQNTVSRITWVTPQVQHKARLKQLMAQPATAFLLQFDFPLRNANLSCNSTAVICLIPRQIQNSKGNNRVGQTKINLKIIYLLNTFHLPKLMCLYITLTLLIYIYIYIYISYIHRIFIQSKYLSKRCISELVGKKREATVPWCVMDK